MKIIRYCFAVTLIITTFSSTLVFASLNSKLEKILNTSCLDPAKSGVSIVDLESGEKVYSFNASKGLKPASLMKLFTTAASLYYLTPSYRFQTSIGYSGQFKDQTITGDLIVKGGGDPLITPEVLFAISHALKRLNIREVTGDLLIDNSLFDRNHKPLSWGNFNSARAYDAKLSAFAINFNTIAVEIYSASSSKDQPRIEIFPNSPDIKIINHLRSKGKSKLTLSRQIRNNQLLINVKGSKKVGEKKSIRYINVPDPMLYSGQIFKAYLNNVGIRINGKIKEDQGHTDFTLLYNHNSPPLRKILDSLNRYSSNFIGEQVAKTMDAKIHDRPGSTIGATALLKEFANKITINTNGSRFADSSGRSSKNRLTTDQVTSLIYQMSKHFDIWPDFLASLPIMGKEGTLKTRLANTAIAGFSRAKTGSLQKVSGLAGIAGRGDQRSFGFAIIFNNTRCDQGQVDRIEEKIIKAIYNSNI
ncbi:MAG: D-alanyl-D-alanine carboxypeptidase/D-alanyl-D-alanine-endopeptidase [Nitrospinota bacterium]